MCKTLEGVRSVGVPNARVPHKVEIEEELLMRSQKDPKNAQKQEYSRPTKVLRDRYY
jgi:hypothetical protein